MRDRNHVHFDHAIEARRLRAKRCMENTNPVSWLRALESDPSALGRLVEESGSLVLAAHRVARARCGNPTAREVAAVAKELAVRTGFFDVLPSREWLAAECGV